MRSGFFIGDFVGKWWYFAFWILLKKTSLTFFLTFFDGIISSALALATQVVRIERRV